MGVSSYSGKSIYECSKNQNCEVKLNAPQANDSPALKDPPRESSMSSANVTLSLSSVAGYTEFFVFSMPGLATFVVDK